MGQALVARVASELQGLERSLDRYLGGVDFDAIDVTNDLERELEMRERAGRTSVPQIFVGDRHLGGFDDIAALDRDGALDPILARSIDKAA